MLEKKAIDVSFAQGLDTKTDPKRVQIGKFVSLENTIFDKGGLLQKRYGYSKLTSLPDNTYSYLTTLNGNLTAVGKNIAAYNTGGSSWVSRGTIQPLSVDTLPVIRNNLNQTAADTAVAVNKVACTAYLENNAGTITAKYVVYDSVTGQNLIAPAVIPVASGTVTGGMRVFAIGSYFIIVFTNVITATSHLQYVAVNIYSPATVTANTDISPNYTSATTLSWDGFVAGNNLYISYNTTSGGQSIKTVYLSSNLVLSSAATASGQIATMVSVTVDMTNAATPIVYVSYYDSSSATGFVLAYDQVLNPRMTATQIITTGAYLNITSAAQNGAVTVFLEKSNNYGFDAAIPTHFVNKRVVTLPNTVTTGTAGSLLVSIRSVGLASKAFIIDGIIYYLSAYKSAYQPTYFLINGSTSLSSAPIIAAKLAYENGGGYLTTGLPGITVTDDIAQTTYLFKDLIQAVNKDTNVVAGTQVNGIYSQTGVNLGTFTFGTDKLDTAEIGSDLHLSGGFLWMYDGYLPVEHNFFLWADNIEGTWSASGGSIASHPQGGSTPDPNPNAYFYQIVYEWTDNQGNAFRSAPSIPISITTTGTGNSGSITLNIPYLRLTAKTSNPVKIVVYRWSLGQQNYYQVTSLTSPTLNDTTADSVDYVDTLADATILGNNLIYTTGGVVEDVNAPASDLITLFDTRLWLVDSEDRNLLWYSKQVIEATPVEMSDLFTLFVPPTTASQGSTGPITSIAPMDDKLIIGKRNAFYYINGSGPDNTGANSQYSQPIFITSTVGCANQKSIVLQPHGLMFQSDKGIWLLNRSLETSYIGAPVQDFTLGATVLSAVSVPETNQIRFTLDTGITIMYDYYYDQWSTFSHVPAVSSCIFQDLHTFINTSGAAYQESVGQYLDGSNPVLMSFTTGPLRLGDLQNYQRAYFFYLLGTFVSPHKLLMSLTYDYENSPSQSILISPTNYSTPFGEGDSQTPFGQGTPLGGGGSLENWRVFLERQRCMAFSITMQEIFDASFDTVAGAGLTMSGINLVIGFKKGFQPQPSVSSVG